MNKKLEKKIGKVLAVSDVPYEKKVAAVANLIKEEMWELQEALGNQVNIMWDDNANDYMTMWINRRYK